MPAPEAVGHRRRQGSVWPVPPGDWRDVSVYSLFFYAFVSLAQQIIEDDLPAYSARTRGFALMSPVRQIFFLIWSAASFGRERQEIFLAGTTVAQEGLVHICFCFQTKEPHDAR